MTSNLAVNHTMIEGRFSEWYSWTAREGLSGTKCPGVYAIAHSQKSLTDMAFTFHKDIIYFGMTNAGLYGRLQQFDNTISNAPFAPYAHATPNYFCCPVFLSCLAFVPT